MQPDFDSIVKEIYLRRAGYDLSIRISGNEADILNQVDGTIVIFDVETNGVARKLRGHTRQIQSLRSEHTFMYLCLCSMFTAGLMMVASYSAHLRIASAFFGT